MRDRETADKARWLPLPGQAEYLDLVRAVLELAADPATKRDPGEILDEVAGYTLAKHPDAFKRREEAGG